MTLLANRPLILVLAFLLLVIFAAGMMVILDDSKAEAHSPPCKTAYPWMRYKITVYVLPDLYWAWFYNASTGATHKHACYAWQL